MDSSDLLRDLDLTTEFGELMAAGDAAMDWLSELDLVAEFRELVVAVNGVDTSSLAGLAMAWLPVAWWLVYCWRVWDRRGRRRGAVPALLWGMVALVAGTVRFLLTVLVVFFGILMLFGRLEGAGRCRCRW